MRQPELFYVLLVAGISLTGLNDSFAMGRNPDKSPEREDINGTTNSGDPDLQGPDGAGTPTINPRTGTPGDPANPVGTPGSDIGTGSPTGTNDTDRDTGTTE